MAATRLIALHATKGRTLAKCLKERTDYAMNPDKTEEGSLVTAYACNPRTVNEDFLLSKRDYEVANGKEKGDVIAYQIRQVHGLWSILEYRTGVLIIRRRIT